MLQEILHCVGGPGLAAVCRCLCEDYSGWMGGMPDLLLWRTSDSQARLVEVCTFALPWLPVAQACYPPAWKSCYRNMLWHTNLLRLDLIAGHDMDWHMFSHVFHGQYFLSVGLHDR